MSEHLIVDGNNILHKWRRDEEFKNLSFDQARYQLIEVLSKYCDWEDIKLTIIFDGSKGGRILSKAIKAEVIFSEQGQSADSIIERMVHSSRNPAEITVATDDSIEQDVVFGFGARFMRSADLKKRIEESSKEMREDLDTRRRENWRAGRLLEDEL